MDGFHPVNVGKLMLGDATGFRPCTPAGVMELLARSGVKTDGAEVVVLGRGNIVGKPMAAMLCQKGKNANATVTICHSATRDIEAHCRRADILIAAMGVAEFVKADMVKPGAAVIDVGVNRVPDAGSKTGTKLVGDVDFADVQKIAGKITPNPGGVGPMTIAMLMQNTVRAAEHFCKTKKFKIHRQFAARLKTNLCKPPEFSPTCNARCCARKSARKPTATSSSSASSTSSACRNCPSSPDALCVFNRWTAGIGQFTENVRLIAPDQTTVLRKGE